MGEIVDAKNRAENKILKVLFKFTLTLTLFNIVYGLILPEKFVSIVGEGPLGIILGISIISLVISAIIGLIPYDNFNYKRRLKFWFLFIFGLYNMFYIYVNLTEFWINKH